MFSLSTRPDLRVLFYDHNDVSIQITPSLRGLATIHDKDILIYCISQLMAAVNAGRAISKVVHLRAHDLLVATNRDTSGDGYKRLRDALERLAGTRITTNYETGGHEVTSGCGLIESWQIVRRSRGGRMSSVTVTLSDWLFRAVQAKSVLTLSRDYFRLRKPLERRIYELVRKHCGRQPSWLVSVQVLHKKSGSASPRRVFRKMLRDMIISGHLPDYQMLEDPGDMIRFERRDQVIDAIKAPAVSPEALEVARAVAPGMDVYALQEEWQASWRRRGAARLYAPDKAFLGWLAKRAEG